MGYAEDSLVPGEEILYEAKISLAIFIVAGIFLVILWVIVGLFWSYVPQLKIYLIVFVILGSILTILQELVIYFTTEFALTNKRIIAKKGLIQRHSLEIVLSKVESITVDQGLGGTIFGYGTVTVIGSGGTHESFSIISNPMELRKRINAKLASL
jgi:uncharacterized membrane protein YdbT with pleckstrin-like domain